MGECSREIFGSSCRTVSIMNILYFFIEYISKIISANFMLPFFVLFCVGLLFAMVFKLGNYND